MESDEEDEHNQLMVVRAMSRRSVTSNVNNVGGPQLIGATHFSVGDPPITKFVWLIENFGLADSEMLYSNIFFVGGYNWQVMLYPKGNNTTNHLSIYLRVAHTTTPPDNWAVWASLKFTLLKKSGPQTRSRGWSVRNFNAERKDWGYPNFISLEELKLFLEDGTLMLAAQIAVYADAHRSIESTRYIGLQNHGSTCCLNALLQTLFHIPLFKRAVYGASRNDTSSGSVLIALKNLFDKLRDNHFSVGTKPLIESCGWDTEHNLMPNQLQDLHNALSEKLGSNMKGALKYLFEGKHMTRVSCYNVCEEFTTEDFFYGLNLDIKGCLNLDAALDKYIEIEDIEGYPVNNQDPQDALKQVLFVRFPHILQIHLNRAEYNPVLGSMVKINDRFQFPLVLDLDKDDNKYLAPEADFCVKNLYTLHRYITLTLVDYAQVTYFSFEWFYYRYTKLKRRSKPKDVWFLLYLIRVFFLLKVTQNFQILSKVLTPVLCGKHK